MNNSNPNPASALNGTTNSKGRPPIQFPFSSAGDNFLAIRASHQEYLSRQTHVPPDQMGSNLIMAQPKIPTPDALIACINRLLEIQPSAQSQVGNICARYQQACNSGIDIEEIRAIQAGELIEDNDLAAEERARKEGELFAELQKKQLAHSAAEHYVEICDSAEVEYWEQCRQIGFRPREVSSEALSQEVDARTGANDERLRELEEKWREVKATGYSSIATPQQLHGN